MGITQGILLYILIISLSSGMSINGALIYRKKPPGAGGYSNKNLINSSESSILRTLDYLADGKVGLSNPDPKKQSPTGWLGVVFWWRRRDLFAFSPWVKIEVSLRQAVASNSPLDCCIFDLQIPPDFPNIKTHHPVGWCVFMAEKEGFEPSIPFWGIHDFQSCALGQLRDFSICAVSPVIIHHGASFVNT